MSDYETPTAEAVAEFIRQAFGDFDDAFNWQTSAEATGSTLLVTVTPHGEDYRPIGPPQRFHVTVADAQPTPPSVGGGPDIGPEADRAYYLDERNDT